MGIPVSLVLIAVGAVLAFAVNQNPDPAVDIDVVGWILMLVGLFGLLLSLWMWERWGPGYWGWHRGSYDPAIRPGYPSRRTVVEEEEGPPRVPPPDAPPPP
jgi:Domain of unknown function (DUF6458)